MVSRKTVAKGMFDAARDQKGFFAKVGAVGRKSSSLPSAEALAKSGKMRSAMVAGGAVGVGAMRKRRGPGTSPTQGRPTGIRNY
jgi:hypothetical protein